MSKELDDYYYNKETNIVVNVYKAISTKCVSSKGLIIPVTIYYVKTNKPLVRRKKTTLFINSRDKWFWCTYKKISKIRAILWW